MDSVFKESVSRFQELTETLHLHKRDLFQRLGRKLRERIFKPVRDVMPGRRERQQRHRRHRLKNVPMGAPKPYFSTHFRFR